MQTYHKRHLNKNNRISLNVGKDKTLSLEDKLFRNLPGVVEIQYSLAISLSISLFGLYIQYSHQRYQVSINKNCTEISILLVRLWVSFTSTYMYTRTNDRFWNQ